MANKVFPNLLSASPETESLTILTLKIYALDKLNYLKVQECDKSPTAC